MGRPQFKQAIVDANDLSDNNISILRRKFALSKLAKTIWNSNAKCFINKSLREELNLLIKIIGDEAIKWQNPISHTMIPRTPDFQAWGDSSLYTAGGYSTDLNFYWHIQWPQSIQSKSVKFFKRKEKFQGEIISINLLEYIVIINNCAISSYLFFHNNMGLTYKYQTLLDWSDNRSAILHGQNKQPLVLQEEKLFLVFFALCLSIMTFNVYQIIRIHTSQNIIADDISRIKTIFSEASFTKLFQDHVALRLCVRFHLNLDCISCLTHAALSGQSPPLQQLPDWKLWEPANSILLNGV